MFIKICLKCLLYAYTLWFHDESVKIFKCNETEVLFYTRVNLLL